MDGQKVDLVLTSLKNEENRNKNALTDLRKIIRINKHVLIKVNEKNKLVEDRYSFYRESYKV